LGCTPRALSECMHLYSLYHRSYLPCMLGVSLWASASEPGRSVVCNAQWARKPPGTSGRLCVTGAAGMLAYRLQQHAVCFDPGNCSCLCMCCSVHQGLACAIYATMGHSRQFWFRAQPPLRASMLEPCLCMRRQRPRLDCYGICMQADCLAAVCFALGSCVFCTCFGIFVVWLRAPSSQQRATAAAACLSWCYVTYPITQCTSALASCIRMLALHTAREVVFCGWGLTAAVQV
jgi:hypothetical protein